jgi:hypothetical protein
VFLIEVRRRAGRTPARAAPTIQKQDQATDEAKLPPGARLNMTEAREARPSL